MGKIFGFSFIYWGLLSQNPPEISCAVLLLPPGTTECHVPGPAVVGGEVWLPPIESFHCKIHVEVGSCRICNLFGELRDQNTPFAPSLPHTPGPGMCEWPCDAIWGAGQNHMF